MFNGINITIIYVILWCLDWRHDLSDRHATTRRECMVERKKGISSGVLPFPLCCCYNRKTSTQPQPSPVSHFGWAHKACPQVCNCRGVACWFYLSTYVVNENYYFLSAGSLLASFPSHIFLSVCSILMTLLWVQHFSLAKILFPQGAYQMLCRRTIVSVIYFIYRSHVLKG